MITDVLPANALGGDIATRGFHALDGAIGTATNPCHGAVLNDIDTQSGRRTRIAPSHRVMPRSTAAPLQRRT
jgi:hypothetical protein